MGKEERARQRVNREKTQTHCLWGSIYVVVQKLVYSFSALLFSAHISATPNSSNKEAHILLLNSKQSIYLEEIDSIIWFEFVSSHFD